MKFVRHDNRQLPLNYCCWNNWHIHMPSPISEYAWKTLYLWNLHGRDIDMFALLGWCAVCTCPFVPAKIVAAPLLNLFAIWKIILNVVLAISLTEHFLFSCYIVTTLGSLHSDQSMHIVAMYLSWYCCLFHTKLFLVAIVICQINIVATRMCLYLLIHWCRVYGGLLHAPLRLTQFVQTRRSFIISTSLSNMVLIHEVAWHLISYFYDHCFSLFDQKVDP
jgi:hypothetical protein